MEENMRKTQKSKPNSERLDVTVEACIARKANISGHHKWPFNLPGMHEECFA